MDCPGKLERTFAIVALAYFAKAFLPFLAGFEVGVYSLKDAAQGNWADQAVGGSIYAVSVGLLFWYAKDPWRLLRQSPLLTAFIVFSLVSSLWSVAPEVTLRRGGGLLGTALFAVYLASRYDPYDVLDMVARAFAIVIVLSIVIIVLVPSYGISEELVAGVYGHKNSFGRAMTLAAICFWALFRDPTLRRPAWAAVAGVVATVLLLLAGSAQAVLSITIAFLILTPLLSLASRFFRRMSAGLFIAGAVVLGLGWLGVVVAADEVLELLGRDATLTDRTVIWELLTELGEERPWKGYGYGAFWVSVLAAWFGERWGSLDHAHNGYVDLWLELGYIGTAGFGMLIVLAAYKAVNLYLANPSPALRFFPLFIATTALLNTVGRIFPEHNSLYWLLLCYCALMPSRESVPARERARSVVYVPMPQMPRF